MRIRLLAGIFVLAGCPVQQAVDDFFEEFGTQPGESTSTGGESTSNDTSTSTAADGESTRDISGSSADAAEASAGEATSEAADTSSTTSGPSSTTADNSFCGDGIVDAPKEECDDGNADDQDNCVFCHRARIIFVTSLRFSGGTVNGLMGADAYCKASANMAKQADPESPLDPAKFLALLSTSTVPAISRHFPGKGPYRLVNGLQVSRSFAALFTEPLENSINVDEYSETQIGGVWSGTDIDGSQYPGIDFCGDWKDDFGTSNVGSVGSLDSQWIHFLVDTDCLSELSIYCIEQE
jgi:hypothetical protein